MNIFPYPKTEELLQLMQSFEIKISHKCDSSAYKKLLETFIKEYTNMPDEFCESLTKQLTREAASNYMCWYYSLMHQWQYFNSTGQFDFADDNYVRLIGIIESCVNNVRQIQAPAI